MVTAQSRQQYRRRRYFTFALLILVLLYIGLCLLLPLRTLYSAAGASSLKISTQTANLPWPSYGESAIGMLGSGVIQTHGQQKPLPIASVAKLITALAVLNKYPLSPGQQGPIITLDATDYSRYTTYVSEQGSVVPVYSGEQLSEYQMLEAMLVPSGNNIADALARWAYGSVANYDAYANTFVRSLGLDSTHVGGDASGFLPTTTSTANDLILLGEKVMQNPVLKQIVGMKSVNVPNVGVMNNYDGILGVDGIVGIKTGNSNQAGGVFLSASNATINGHTVTLLTALMGAPNLSGALSDSVPLVVSLQASFSRAILVSKGEVLGEFKQPWGGNIQIAAQGNLANFLLQGQSVNALMNIHGLKVPSPSSTAVGSISVPANQFNLRQSIPLVTLQPTTKPSLVWRLTHPEAEI